MLIGEWSQVLNQSLNPPTVLKHSRNMLACMRSDQRERESMSVLLLHQTLTDSHSTDSVNVCWWILLREEKDVKAWSVCFTEAVCVCVCPCLSQNKEHRGLCCLIVCLRRHTWWRAIMSHCKNSLSVCLHASLLGDEHHCAPRQLLYPFSNNVRLYYERQAFIADKLYCFCC